MSITAENFEKQPLFYLNNAIKSKKALSISSDNGDAVLISAELFELLREEYELEMSLRRGEEDIEAGKVFSLDKTFDNLKEYIDTL